MKITLSILPFRKTNLCALRLALVALYFCGFTPSTAFSEAETAGSPNFLFIVVDDLNDWVRAMDAHPQARQAKTPNMDRLAENGTLFLNAHCPAPICGPSRAALWTGLAPSTTGIYFHIHDDRLADNLPEGFEAHFLPHLLEQAGYHTLGAGKLFHQGDRAGVFQEFGPGFTFGPRPESGLRLNFEPTWTGAGYTSTDWGAFPENDEDLPDYAIRKWAVNKLAGPIHEPFFMGVGFVRPHVPWYVPQKWFDLFDRDSLQTPPHPDDELADLPAIARLLQMIPGYPTTEWAQLAGEWKDIVHAYLACTAFVDHQVGLVLDALAASPYADNTIIILLSDHGYHLGEKNRFNKMSLWERDTKIPMMIAGKNLPAGRRTDAPVNLMDLYATVLDLAGLQIPADRDAHSLVPLLEEETETEWNRAALTTFGRNNHSLRSRDWRYIVYEDGSEELYDHRVDPWEHHNLAQDSSLAPIIEKMRTHLPTVNAPLARESLLPITEYLRERSRAWRAAEH